jgi:hypothetical protein
MKNIHILPTDKPSRLYKQTGKLLLDTISDISTDGISTNQHIYITSNEEIKVGDWVIEFQKGDDIGEVHFINSEYIIARDIQKKIILTTDELYIHNDLIPKEYNTFPQYIQKIDYEFLEWFVKNPNCEDIEISYGLLKPFQSNYAGYIIHLPDTDVLEEPKQEIDMSKYISGIDPYDTQETLEEAAEHNYPNGDVWTEEQAVIRRLAFMNGARWQAERMYSEEEVLKIIRQYALEEYLITSSKPDIWFEQFKKK